MSSIELTASTLAQHGWQLTVMFTVATLCVTLLRRPCRYLFGAERAFQLWLLPPLVLWVSQLPHHVGTMSAALPALMVTIISGAGTWQAVSAATTSINWRVVMLGLWLLGMLFTTLFAVIAQQRYRRLLRGATLLAERHVRWPVWRAARADVGPALIGAWRPRIVLPADFEGRYDAHERTLILAHEAAHAHRRDGYWALCAQVLASVFWFHPLMWWALRVFRHDQELACDAVVLRQHGELRRSYASAMLKTQSVALSLPVGCQWSPRHPLAERIAMLKHARPGKVRSFTGYVAVAALAIGVSSMVYAGTAVHQQEYQLSMKVGLGSDDGHQAHVQRVTFALCTASGKVATVSIPDWKVSAMVMPEEGGQLRIDLGIQEAGSEKIWQSRVQDPVGDVLHFVGKSQDGKHQYTFEVTPLMGCPARDTAKTKEASRS